PGAGFAAARRIATAVIVAAGFAIGLACDQAPNPAPPVPQVETAHPVTFTDVTRAAGIAFKHHSGAVGKKYLPETMGAGLVFFDADGDGHVDLYFVQSRDWPENRGAPQHPAFYRNKGDGTFEDATKRAGLDVETYGIGAAAADYDNDGDVDLFVNALGPDHLFRNRGNGTFEEVAKSAGVGDPAFGSSATWVDYDRDGFLDLFVANYVQWTAETDIYCTLDGAHKSYCTPESYRGATNRLYRNRGDGTFEDATAKAGVLDPTGKSLGVAALDFDDDGFIDLAVANDTQPNFLYRNRGDGTFEEVGKTAGIAYSEEGKARGAMGIDAGDYDDSGRPSLLIGNFSNEMLALYHNEGKGLFIDDAAAAGIGQPSLLTLAFGCFFFDYDLDGRLDLFVANGHVENEINAVQPSVTYAEPPHLFRGDGTGRFEETTAKAGADLARPVVARGAAYADIDNDGDLDVAYSTNNGPAALFRNDGGNGDGFVRLRLVGTASNRDGIGARLRLKAGARTLTRTLQSAASYASQSEGIVTFGLGSKPPKTVDIEVRWPNGRVETYPGLETGRLQVLTEKGATDK
ncbi:MAG TPA: CRTAC1 family protein, partial [Candidatus Polarisedimenticolia bacterium]|nr:CRTAC1 family protein [Candidatus Polarisedimenticolia bacterium]